MTLASNSIPFKCTKFNQLLAIWDNRTVLHSATMDFAGLGPRTGHRVVSIGERPYMDPNSKTRREALAAEAAKLST